MTSPSPVADAQRPPGAWRRFRSSGWFQLILAFVVVGLVLAFIAKPYSVPSGSMENTLQPGDRVLVYRLAYDFGAAPRTGDIVVFDADSTWGAQPAENWLKTTLRWIGALTGFGPTGTHTLVKRVIATPGEKVSCCSATGQVMVNGHPLHEPYLSSNYPFTPGTLDCTSATRSLRCFGPVTVPANDYLVLGDNRADSSDSAYQCRGAPPSDTSCFRWAKRSEVVGRVVAILWPIGRWQGF